MLIITITIVLCNCYDRKCKRTCKAGDDQVKNAWKFLLLLALLAAFVLGKTAATAEALLSSGAQAVTLMLTLMGAMTLWSGLMEILSETGDAARLSRLIRRTCGGLFPGLMDDDCWRAMGMNIAANLLGLGNAATPAGVRAAQLLADQGECGLRALAMLLVLNNTGLTLLPTTVITLRQAAGSADPAGIWGPSLVVSAVATVIGAGLMWLITRRQSCRG